MSAATERLRVAMDEPGSTSPPRRGDFPTVGAEPVEAFANLSIPSERISTTRQVRRPIETESIHTEGTHSDRRSLLHELVRYATLAASSHNTQCRKFHVEEHAISILPDLSRRLPVVDPDDHHLFGSLGCAVENQNKVA